MKKALNIEAFNRALKLIPRISLKARYNEILKCNLVQIRDVFYEFFN